MKLLALLIFITGISGAVYLFIIHIKKIDWKAFKIAAIFGLVLAVLMGVLMYKASGRPDTWCTGFRDTTAYPPMETKTATDYFEKGNYDYDTGNCSQAIESYTKSIELNPDYPQSYNNRAFTYTRMQEYDKALEDLNMALELNPNYINALMNRGDIYNYRKDDKEKAVADYEKIISLSGTTNTSVCGHLAMAQHYSKNPLSFIKAVWATMNCRGRSN